MNKQQGALLSLLNDESLASFSLLLLSEPSIIVDNKGRVFSISQHHSYWIPILPSIHNQQHPVVCSMIWAHHSLQVHQIPVQLLDITVIIIQIEDMSTLILFVYILPKKDISDITLI